MVGLSESQANVQGQEFIMKTVYNKVPF